ncbi:MAG: regulatory protein RecX [Oscillospiraceae bacterium]|nr:regulatory protein RecX [Oscillospiraceae bacterium]
MIISINKGKNNKIHIHLDGEYKATVDSDWWYSEKYRNYKEITEEELTELLNSVSFRRAYNKGLDILSRRPYSEKELARKLKDKDFSDEAIEYAVNRLKELSLLDDERYAEILVEHLYSNKHYGEKRILQELSVRGIDRDTARNAVLALDKDEINSIVLLLEGKFKGKMNDEKGKQRTVAALLRYGYSYSDIKSALNKVSETLEEDFYE